MATPAQLRRLDDVERADDVRLETEARVLDRGPERKHRHVEYTVDPLHHPPKAFDVGDVTLDDVETCRIWKVLETSQLVEDSDVRRSAIEKTVDHV